MQDKIPFVGIGHNPEGPDLPLGFGMQLAQEPEAMAAYGRLSGEAKASVIRYIQNSTTGADAKNRIASAVENLKTNNTSIF